MKILVAGDLIPTERNYSEFENGHALDLLGDGLAGLWKAANFRIVNLETPLTNATEKIKKHGQNIKTNPLAVSGLVNLQIDIVNLANNHILDYGQIGLQDTIHNLAQSKIDYIGITDAKKKSKSYKILSDNRLRIGVYGCADREFSTACNGLSGAVPYDYFETGKTIKQIRAESDYVIVLFHGGTEFYPYPTVNLRKICCALVDAGADIVICQHGHCIAAFEEYNGGTIIYGQGHFISNLSQEEMLQHELLVEIEFTPKKYSVRYIPLEVVGYRSIRLSSEEEAKSIINGFRARSADMSEPFLQKKYREFLITRRNSYLMAIKGNRLFDRVLLKVFREKYAKRIYTETQLRVIYNYISSYAHLEALQEIMREEIDQ